MNGLERLIASSNGEPTDCVAVAPGIGHYAAFQARQPMTRVAFDPELVPELVHLATEAGRSFGEAQITHGGVKTVNVYEPLSALISPNMADTFSFSYLAELIAHLHGLGAKVLLHICNDTMRLLERMVRSGADILSLDAQVDLAQARSIVNDGVAISGNVATQHLARLSPGEIYDESCRAIESAAPGSRFTLSSSCEVPIETPAANVDAMVRAARTFGRA